MLVKTKATTTAVALLVLSTSLPTAQGQTNANATEVKSNVVSTKTVKKSLAIPFKYGSPNYNKAYAKQSMKSKYGWGAKQYSCLVTLWNHESGWRVSAHNSSGAHGIPQALPGKKMASAGPNWKTNPHTQIKWGLKYINGRYGTPCSALKSWNHKGWY